MSAEPSMHPLDEVLAASERIHRAVASVIDGKDEVIATALTVLLAEGHLLLEDVPGLGKTMLAKALAQAIDGSVRRIQFTPDLLPSDITGVSIFNQDRHQFEFKPGPVFANVLLGDEINRASPKTQSALLECMEEHQVTVDGATYHLAQPFMVIATQNPVEMDGTHPLPEAQRDRFMARVSMGYPHPDAEVRMLDRHSTNDPLAALRPVVSVSDITRMVRAVLDVHASSRVKEYVVSLVGATRRHPGLRLGASPRASLHLLRAARARAALCGRDYVSPDDIQAMAQPVLTHRLLTTGDAELSGRRAEDVLIDVMNRVPVGGR